MNDSLRLTVQYALNGTFKNKNNKINIPLKKQFKQWSQAALAAAGASLSVEIHIRLVESAEMAQLNATYRHKNGPTNVLSFPYTAPIPLKTPLLGDIIICPEVLAQEAQAQHKPLIAHWAHLTVHGVLHLLGYDHEIPEEQQIMEPLEIKILAALGYADPYYTDGTDISGVA